MKTLRFIQRLFVWLLILALALPPPAFGQDGKAGIRKFSQEEMDQMLAPIALYPDSLLAQIFIASTYPLEVVMADRWAKQNKDLKGDELNNALAKQSWDPSVKALVPLPDVLTMMSQKLDWTQMIGDAFIAQQGDVMDTVQRLRKKASDAGNLRSSAQQNVIVEREVIRIEPYDPRVVYVPVYDPWWVYGRWWWPLYPPYVVYPYPVGVAIAPGFIWFGAGLFLGAYWGYWGYWGHWNWPGHGCYVNVNRNVTVTPRGAVGGAFATQPWTHNPAHRGGVAYRDQVTRERFGQQANRAAVESRRSFRGYEGNWIERGARTGKPDSAAGRTGRPETVSSVMGRTEPATGRIRRADATTGRIGSPDRTSRPDAAVARPGTVQQAPDRTRQRPEVEQSGSGRAFEGIGQGSEVRRQSNWGRESLNAARSGGGTVGDLIRGGTNGGAVRGGGWGAGGNIMRGGHR
jgi:hypothetical protein